MRKIALALALLAGVALADNSDKEAEEAVATFKKAYASKDESARLAAVEALGQIQNHRVADALASPLSRDSALSVRRAAAKVLGAQWDKGAVLVLMKALNPDDPAKDVTTAIMNALGETENEQAVPLLLSLLTPKRKGQQDESFTAPALAALKRIGSAKAAEDLVTFLNRESAGQGRGRRGGGGGGASSDPLSKDAEATLQSITGQRFTNAREWRKWWNENKDSLKTIPVYRCTGTGKTFDKTTGSTKCPHDGDQHPSCGYLLKTRFPNGGFGGPDSSSSNSNGDEKKHKKKKEN